MEPNDSTVTESAKKYYNQKKYGQRIARSKMVESKKSNAKEYNTQKMMGSRNTIVNNQTTNRVKE